MSSAPIADLSYRSYDGPLDEPRYRWWVIARMLIKQTFKKKAFWVWSIAAGLNFYLTAIILYYIDSNIDPANPANAQNPMVQMFRAITWKDVFLTGFGHMQLFLLFVAMLGGAGAIANDNRANALLVYLSKPCRKQDYILGKWIGLALLVAGVALAQLTLFYLYGLMSYRDYGFFTQDRLLYPKLVLVAMVAGAVYSSIVIGISSMFSQGRLAGATLAGFYFITFSFSTLMMWIRMIGMAQGEKMPKLLDPLTYCSIDGLNIGLAKVILHTSGSVFNPGNGRRRGQPETIELVPAPSGLVFTLIALVICGLFMYIAWKRVRAVEVVS